MQLYLTPQIVSHPVTVAYQNWLLYAIEIGGLRTTLYTAYELFEQIPNVQAALRNVEHVDNSDEVNVLLDAARKERTTEYKNFHALWLIGMWGAFEAFVEDACRGMIATKPEILQNDAFKNITINAADLHSGAEAVNDELFRQLKSRKPSKDGEEIGRLRNLLKAANLSDKAPTDLSDTIWEAQCVRNLWAHQAGRADQHFLDRCKSVQASIGDYVVINRSLAEKYATALVGFAHVVFNRFLLGEGLPALRMSGMGQFQSSFDAEFPTAVKSHLTPSA